MRVSSGQPLSIGEGQESLWCTHKDPTCLSYEKSEFDLLSEKFLYVFLISSDECLEYSIHQMFDG